MSNQVPEDFTFEGRDGTECNDFIRFLRRKAFAERALNDDTWMATLASLHFSGSALRWHASLDRSTRSSWELLERALIQRYPFESEGYESSDHGRSSQYNFSAPPKAATASPTTPSPAAAASPISPETPSSRSNSNPFSGFFSSRFSKTGRIRVAIPGTPNIGYISAIVSSGQKHMTLTKIPGEALQVRVPGSRGVVGLKMMNSVWPYLGLTWSDTNPSYAQDSTDSAVVVGVDPEAYGKGGALRGSSTWAKGSSHFTIWRIQGDRELTLECPDDSDATITHPLQVAVNMQKIRFVSRFDAFQRKMSGCWSLATLWLEPLP